MRNECCSVSSSDTGLKGLYVQYIDTADPEDWGLGSFNHTILIVGGVCNHTILIVGGVCNHTTLLVGGVCNQTTLLVGGV